MRVYFDYNATAPFRAEAKNAMIEAMDIVGNPSSVHAEGRKSKALVENARQEIASAFGADGADMVFTSGATEAASLALAGRGLCSSEIEHDAVVAWTAPEMLVTAGGCVHVTNPASSTLQLANSETGVVQELPEGLAVSDMTQAFGKLPLSFNWSGSEMALISAHKLGGPKGVGALVLKRGVEVVAQLRGGGQEMGRRAGTENVIGAVGFAAAAKAAVKELSEGTWERIAYLRDLMEEALAIEAKSTIFIGKGMNRLPNTSCIATPGWKSETQVMQMDLSGYAISAGSACSSGKVRESRVLRAMGFDETTAVGAVRISLGPKTTEEDVMGFVETWLAHLKKHRNRIVKGAV